MIVVDASVLAPAFGDDGIDGHRFRTRLRGERIVAPEIVDLEVLTVWRRMAASGALSASRAERAIEGLSTAAFERVPHRALLPRCWQLRGNVTEYDAVYVALAEFLGAVLVTADARLARAPGPRCRFDVM